MMTPEEATMQAVEQLDDGSMFYYDVDPCVAGSGEFGGVVVLGWDHEPGVFQKKVESVLSEYDDLNFFIVHSSWKDWVTVLDDGDVDER